MTKLSLKSTLATLIITGAIVVGVISLSSTNVTAKTINTKPELFNHLPQDTLFIAHSSQANKGLDLYKNTQLYKELSQIDYKQIIHQLQPGQIATFDQAELDKIFSKKNRELVFNLLNSSISLAILKPDYESIKETEFNDSTELLSTLLENSILQIHPQKAEYVQALVERLKELDKDDYSKSEEMGYTINNFKIDKDYTFTILEKSGIFTLTLNEKKTIKLLTSPLDKNMNNLSEVDPVYAEAHDSVAYLNLDEINKMVLNLETSEEMAYLLEVINYNKEFLTWSDLNVQEQSENSILIKTFDSEKTPTYFKSLLANKKSSKTLQLFPNKTALFYSFTGLPFNEITDYFAKQNGVKISELLKADPKLGVIYNQLTLALGNDYAFHLSGVKPGMIPLPLATIALEVKSEKILKTLITTQLEQTIKNGVITKLTKTLNGTEITTFVTPLPGLTPAYMFYNGYFMLSTDPTELIAILNLKPGESLGDSASFKKVILNKNAACQITYLNGEKLFGDLENVLKGLMPLLAQKPADKVLFSKLIIPVVSALRNIENGGSVTEAISETESRETTKFFVK
jgi:hypothetical protein